MAMEANQLTKRLRKTPQNHHNTLWKTDENDQPIQVESFPPAVKRWKTRQHSPSCEKFSSAIANAKFV